MPYRLRWTGASDQTNIATAGNWYDLDALATAGAAPVTGDSAEVIDTSHNLTGTLTSANLTSWYFGPMFQGTIDVTISCASGSTPVVTYASNCSTARITAGSSNITKLKCLGGALSVVSGTVTTLETTTGAISVLAAAVVTTHNGAGAPTTFAYNATAVTTCTVQAGSMSSNRSITTLNVAGNGTRATTTLAAAITTANVNNGARLNHQSSGTITTANCYTGARMDAQGSPYVGFTVTNANVWAGSSYFAGETSKITATNAAIPIGSNELA